MSDNDAANYTHATTPLQLTDCLLLPLTTTPQLTAYFYLLIQYFAAINTTCNYPLITCKIVQSFRETVPTHPPPFFLLITLIMTPPSPPFVASQGLPPLHNHADPPSFSQNYPNPSLLCLCYVSWTDWLSMNRNRIPCSSSFR